jgi:NAD(P)-dependent dehydrogenase (short-subunit alcohol dehydrogenase family)
VTGAAGGIGRAMTRALLAAGIRVAGVDRDREPLEALAASAREQGKAAELLTIAGDLTDDSAVDAITKATRVKFGRIVHWDTALPPEQAAEKAGAPVAWHTTAPFVRRWQSATSLRFERKSLRHLGNQKSL